MSGEKAKGGKIHWKNVLKGLKKGFHGFNKVAPFLQGALQGAGPYGVLGSKLIEGVQNTGNSLLQKKGAGLQLRG